MSWKDAISKEKESYLQIMDLKVIADEINDRIDDVVNFEMKNKNVRPNTGLMANPSHIRQVEEALKAILKLPLFD